MRLIRKIKTACPICDTTHEVCEYESYTSTVIKDKDVDHLERFCSCEESDNPYETAFYLPSQVDKNLKVAKTEYRKIYC